MTSRIRRVKDKKEFDRTVDDFITQGYAIISEGAESIKLRKKTWGSVGGHVLVVIIFGWWTFLISNLIYAVIAHYAAEEVVVKLGDS